MFAKNVGIDLIDASYEPTAFLHYQEQGEAENGATPPRTSVSEDFVLPTKGRGSPSWPLFMPFGFREDLKNGNWVSGKTPSETGWKMLGWHAGNLRSAPWRAADAPRICTTTSSVASGPASSRAHGV